MGRIKFKTRWKLLIIGIFLILHVYSVYYLYTKFKYYISFLSKKEDEIRRNEIRNVMKYAWNSYVEYAWGYDFLNPQSRHGSNLMNGLGYTIIDSLDSLLIMEMNDEFNDALYWINNVFQYSLPFVGEVSFFETVIRSLGGLLTAYEQTNIPLLLQLAKKIGDRLLPNFNTPSGIPRVLINMMTGQSKDFPWANTSSLLADSGSCQIEFLALSHHTGRPIYHTTSMNARRNLQRLGPIPPTQFFYRNLWPSHFQFSFDAFGDSYFEYLLKMKLYAPFNLTEKDRPLDFRHSIESAINRLAFTSWETGYEYLATSIGDEFTHSMSHLSFFLPGTLFLAAQQDCDYNKKIFCTEKNKKRKKRCEFLFKELKSKNKIKSENANLYFKENEKNDEVDDEKAKKIIKNNEYLDNLLLNVNNLTKSNDDDFYELKDDFDCDFDFDCDCNCDCNCKNNVIDESNSCYNDLYLKLANNLLKTAINLYKMQPTNIGGEVVNFISNKPGVFWKDDTYKLRPELIESLFYSWRITHDVKSKMVAWEIFKAIQKYCRTESGYTTIQQTSSKIIVYDNMQDSFFLSETLKYLYLIFSDDDFFSLDDYVFTTQAHPLKKLLFNQ